MPSCDVPEPDGGTCGSTDGVRTVRDEGGDLLDMCRDCRAEWPNIETVATDGGRNYQPPKIIDHVETPVDATCEQYSGEPPTPCENDAEYLIVFDANPSPGGETRPRNMLVCGSCYTPPEEPIDVVDDKELVADGGMVTADLQADNTHDISIAHAGQKTFHSESEGDFIDREVVEVRCDTMDEARDVGEVVSLLNDHDADEIVAGVEGGDE